MLPLRELGACIASSSRPFRQLECELQAKFCLCANEMSYSSSLLVQLLKVGILEVQQCWSKGQALDRNGLKGTTPIYFVTVE